MAEIAFTPEYLKVSELYEKRFGKSFDGIPYDTDESIEIMNKCLNTGRPYDLSKDPNYDPDAKY